MNPLFDLWEISEVTTIRRMLQSRGIAFESVQELKLFLEAEGIRKSNSFYKMILKNDFDNPKTKAYQLYVKHLPEFEFNESIVKQLFMMDIKPNARSVRAHLKKTENCTFELDADYLLKRWHHYFINSRAVFLRYDDADNFELLVSQALNLLDAGDGQLSDDLIIDVAMKNGFRLNSATLGAIRKRIKKTDTEDKHSLYSSKMESELLSEIMKVMNVCKNDAVRIALNALVASITDFHITPTMILKAARDIKKSDYDTALKFMRRVDLSGKS